MYLNLNPILVYLIFIFSNVEHYLFIVDRRHSQILNTIQNYDRFLVVFFFFFYNISIAKLNITLFLSLDKYSIRIVSTLTQSKTPLCLHQPITYIFVILIFPFASLKLFLESKFGRLCSIQNGRRTTQHYLHMLHQCMMYAAAIVQSRI